MDYMIHNLDQSTSILQNLKTIGNGLFEKNNKLLFINSRDNLQINSVQHLAPIVRRLYRLFSHTYYSHNEIFNEFEVL